MTRREVAETALVFLGALLFFAHLYWLLPGIAGPDPYFHHKMAQLVRTSGPVTSFPWTQHSVFREGFSDSSFLYHVLLVPFTFVSDEVTGIRLGGVFFAGLFVAVFHGFLLTNRCRFPVLFTLLLTGAGAIFLYRLCQNRGYLLAMTLSILVVHACLHGRHHLLLALAIVYPLSYTAFQVVLLLAFFHNFAQWCTGEAIDRRLFPLALGGSLLGLTIHPNFPHSFSLWWTQNVRVLGLKWAGTANLTFGGELYPPDLGALMFSSLSLFIIGLVGIVTLMLVTRRRTVGTVSLLFAALGFGVMTLLSRRFIEYSCPFMVATAAFLFRDLVSDDELDGWCRGRPGHFHAAAFVLMGLVFGLAIRSYREVGQNLPTETPPGLKDAALFLKKNVRPGEVIYAADWDDFPELFFYNDRNRYVSCLDPVFLYEYDRALWLCSLRIMHGQVPDLYAAVRWRFDSRWILATNDLTPLIQRARQDPRMEQVFRDPAATIFRLGDDLDFVTEWSISGPYARLRKDLDDRLVPALEGRAPLPPDVAPSVTWPASRLGSYVDLESLFDGPEHCAAIATCTITSPEDQPAELRLGFDDAIRVWLDGREIFASDGPSASRIDQVAVRARLKKGASTLTVRSTNYTLNWGFYARFVNLKSPVVRTPGAERRK